MIDPKVAPAIQQHRDELEKRKIEDSLRHKINHRPTPEALVEQNILKGNIYMFQLGFRSYDSCVPCIFCIIKRSQSCTCSSKTSTRFGKKSIARYFGTQDP
jgi:hypothetical protein